MRIARLIGSIILASTIVLFGSNAASANPLGGAIADPTQNAPQSLANCNGSNWSEFSVSGNSAHLRGGADSCAAVTILNALHGGPTDNALLGILTSEIPGVNWTLQIAGVFNGIGAQKFGECVDSSQGNGVSYWIVYAGLISTVVECGPQAPVVPDPPACPIGQICPYRV